MTTTPRIPKIGDEERTPLVATLLEIIQIQQEQILQLKNEIARLKGQKPRPEKGGRCQILANLNQRNIRHL
jgi:hypothetical protein